MAMVYHLFNILFAGRGDEILYFENFDLKSIQTPVNIDKLQQLLQETNYSKSETEFLCDGFKNGFSLGY